MAAARSKFNVGTTTVLVVVISLMMGLACCMDSEEVKRLVEKMKDQLQEVEQTIITKKAHIESEREIIFEVINGNTAKAKTLRSRTYLPLWLVEAMEGYTADVSTNVRESFTDMTATVAELESMLEDMKAQVRFVEMHQDMFTST